MATGCKLMCSSPDMRFYEMIGLISRDSELLLIEDDNGYIDGDTELDEEQLNQLEEMSVLII